MKHISLLLASSLAVSVPVFAAPGQTSAPEAITEAAPAAESSQTFMQAPVALDAASPAMTEGSSALDIPAKEPKIDMTPKPRLIPRDLPHLSVIGKNGLFYVGVGGAVKATASFDFGHVIDDPNMFTTANIPVRQPEGDGGKFQVSAQQSELFLTFGYLPGQKYEVSAYVNGFFLGDNYSFKLQNAYLRFLGFTAGYGWGLFYDSAASPTTIDFEGPSSELQWSKGILDYQYTFGRWTVGAGLEVPIASFTVREGMSRKVNQRIPDFPVMVQYNFPSGHLRAAVILRGLQYRNLIEEKNKTRCGWGVTLSGTGTIYGPLQFFFQGALGKGMTSYFQDLGGGGLDMVPEAGGNLTTVKAWGGFAGLQYNFSKKVFASATYSHVRTYAKRYDGGETPWGEQYKYAQYVAANVFWNITPIVRWGMEYLYGRRVNMDCSQGHDNRLQTMLQVSF